MKKFLKHLALIVALLVAQLSLVPALPDPLRQLNLLLTVVIFICVAYEFHFGVVYAVIIGFVIDLYSGLPFGAVTVSLLLTLLAVYGMFRHLLTNKSYYSLLGLNLMATIVYGIMIRLFQLSPYFLQTKDLLLVERIVIFSAREFWWQLLLNSILISVIFAVFHFISRRFKAVFIDTTKS